MFCCKCGILAAENAKFCHICGLDFRQSRNSAGGDEEMHCFVQPSGIGEVDKGFIQPTVKSFEKFRQEKGRQWKDRVKGKKRKEKHVKEEDVTICIGLMEWRESECKLKIKRGKRISCKVSNMDTRMGVLIKAENKWRQYHPDFYDTEEEYCLLYESGEKVTTIPGCEEDFILHRYREEVGKDYKRIVLYQVS
ncbi:uncharacterized protein LOC130644940 [Hydractinia symbiolongicarpus]|uniref:uncharacterized protein LOC130644940 n=1 Tax=Hydractinia symbiolongicarpus TaxID=13093 RepID=UPI002549E686|nr:uncharacterized protein LOC130644940 [Hydractinia symbiolongicarpus]